MGRPLQDTHLEPHDRSPGAHVSRPARHSSAPAFPVANSLQNWRASAPAPARSGVAVAAKLDSSVIGGLGPARIIPRARDMCVVFLTRSPAPTCPPFPRLPSQFTGSPWIAAPHQYCMRFSTRHVNRVCLLGRRVRRQGLAGRRLSITQNRRLHG